MMKRHIEHHGIYVVKFSFYIVLKISAHRTMWSVTNYFLVNLTIADLLMATLNCIPSFIFMRDRWAQYIFRHDKENNWKFPWNAPISIIWLFWKSPLVLCRFCTVVSNKKRKFGPLSSLPTSYQTYKMSLKNPNLPTLISQYRR